MVYWQQHDLGCHLTFVAIANIDSGMDFVQRVFDLIDSSVALFYYAKDTAQFVVASTYPHARLVNSMCFALSAAIRIRSQQKDKKFYWLHAFALILFAGYGGGLFTPVLMGKRRGNEAIYVSVNIFYYTYELIIYQENHPPSSQTTC
jgi:hypothetical protein